MVIERTYRTVRGVAPPSIGDPEPIPTELKRLRPAERPADQFDTMYAKRVEAGQIRHATSAELWLETGIAKLEKRAAAARGTPKFQALCHKLQNERHKLAKMRERERRDDHQ